MASTSETGHSKNVSNFETMISYCTGYGVTYNPSNSDILLSELTTLRDDSKASVKLVKTTETPFNDVEGQRKLIFKPLKPLATKVLGALRGANAPSTVIADAETINRKIQGKRADNSVVETPVGETPKDKISVSQQSYDMQIDHLDKLIELVTIEPKYNPNETPLKVVTLIDYKTQLETVNATVKNTYTPYSNAMIARNKKLYNSETGLVARAQTVKNYVKSVFGASSPEYKQISKLNFKNRAE
ncbi:hypothetical protein [Flavobacterium psychrophilum]|uniref:Uncharacterized protein n=1 Tax=Flavobacterium psychrophilum TaxID=96345 RepID=A0A7U2NH53_FLAPS|nr:hypothetical protein [Flavobacterium psychrophilum]QRE04875.1 hypothetical protein H0H26_04610 [Flavobacterium psychrophilum]